MNTKNTQSDIQQPPFKKQIGLPTEKALVEAGYGEADVEAMRL